MKREIKIKFHKPNHNVCVNIIFTMRCGAIDSII